jgi:hypothetical protein
MANVETLLLCDCESAACETDGRHAPANCGAMATSQITAWGHKSYRCETCAALLRTPEAKQVVTFDAHHPMGWSVAKKTTDTTCDSCGGVIYMEGLCRRCWTEENEPHSVYIASIGVTCDPGCDLCRAERLK